MSTRKPAPSSESAPARLQALLGPLLVLAVALTLRAVYLLEMHHEDLFRIVMGDALSYDAWGTEIAGGNWIGKDVFYQAPLYPYFLGVVYAIFGHSLAAARWVQILMGSLSCVFLYVAARRLWNPTVALVAGLGLAVYPPAIFFDALIQKSVLDVFLLTALLAVLAPLAARPESPRRWISSGALLALLALTRENALVLAALVFLWALAAPGRLPWGRRFRHGVLLMAGVLAVLLPVAFRNQAVGGEFHLTTSQFGPNLYIGNHPGAEGTYDSLRPGRGDARFERLDATEIAEAAQGRRLTPGQVSRYWADRAVAFMTERPGEWLRLMGRKAMLVLNRVEISDTEAQEVYAERSWLLRLLGPLLHFGVLVPLAALGIALCWPERRRLAVPLLFLLGYAGSIVVFYVFGRYRYPLAPLLLMFAAAGLVEGVRRARRREWRSMAPALAALGVAAVLANWPLVDPARGRAATYTNLGRVMAESRRNEESLAYYRKALALDDENFVIHNNIANQLYRMQRDREALPHYEKALRLRPDYAEAHNNYANLLLRLGRWNEAESHYRTAVTLNPRYPEAWANLGSMAVQKGLLDEAIACFQQAVAIDPNFQGAAKNLRILLDLKAKGQPIPR